MSRPEGSSRMLQADNTAKQLRVILASDSFYLIQSSFLNIPERYTLHAHGSDAPKLTGGALEMTVSSRFPASWNVSVRPQNIKPETYIRNA